MNDGLVQVWLYDTANKNKLTGTIKVPQGTKLLVGQTYIEPEAGLYGTPMFDEGNQRWFGLSKEDWLKTNPYNGNNQSEPDSQQLVMANLMKDNASLKKQYQDQVKINVDLMKDVAVLKKTVATLTPAQVQ